MAAQVSWANGAVSLVAGALGSTGSVDGAALTGATFFHPVGLVSARGEGFGSGAIGFIPPSGECVVAHARMVCCDDALLETSMSA